MFSGVKLSIRSFNLFIWYKAIQNQLKVRRAMAIEIFSKMYQFKAAILHSQSSLEHKEFVNL